MLPSALAAILYHEQSSNHLCSAGTSASFKNDAVSCTLTPATTGTGLIYAVSSIDGTTKYKIGYTVSHAAHAALVSTARTLLPEL